MTLLLDNDDVRSVLSMRACIDALELAFADYAPPLDREPATLGDVVLGRAGRTSDDQITLFTGGGGLGLQFAAVGHAVYQAAAAARIGRELPTEWFTQLEKP